MFGWKCPYPYTDFKAASFGSSSLQGKHSQEGEKEDILQAGAAFTRPAVAI